MRRILHVISGLNTGGAERALTRLIGHGLSDRFENHVISLTGEGTETGRVIRAGARIHDIDAGFFPARISKAVSICRSVRPDMIQGWMYHGNIAASAAAAASPGSPPVVWGIRQSLSDLANEKPMTRAVIRAGAVISKQPAAIVYNSGLAKAQHEAFGYASDRSVFIPNGFGAAQGDKSAESRVTFWKQFGIDGRLPVVLNVGRFHPVKGHRQLVSAAKKILAENAAAQFVLVGLDVTPERFAAEGLVAEVGSERLKLVGLRQNVDEFMAHSDIFVLSSLAEAFPNVVGEAMAAGLPCVATDVGDARHIVGSTGTIVAAGDAEGLKNAIERYLCDPLLREQHGAAAKERIAKHFSIDAVATAYIELYERILAGKVIDSCAD